MAKVIGIDLGTTNSALAYAEVPADGDAPPTIRAMPIPQVVGVNDIGERAVLPSFLYLPGPNEQPAGALKLPWAPDRDFAVGEFARNFGSQVPTRLVASAKSWLCHSGAGNFVTSIASPVMTFCITGPLSTNLGGMRLRLAA